MLSHKFTTQQMTQQIHNTTNEKLCAISPPYDNRKRFRWREGYRIPLWCRPVKEMRPLRAGKSMSGGYGKELYCVQ